MAVGAPFLKIQKKYKNALKKLSQTSDYVLISRANDISTVFLVRLQKASL